MTTTDADEASRRARADKVRALLAKAASTTHDGEREAFEAKALELMVKWELAERDLAEGSPLASFTYSVEHMGNARQPSAFFVANLLELFGGYAAYWPGDRTVRGFGSRSINADVAALADHLLDQLMADIVRDRPRSRKDYGYGWVTRVQRRLREAHEVIYSQSNALVPTNAEARESFIEAFGGGRTVSHRAGTDALTGDARGSMADLGQQRVTG